MTNERSIPWAGSLRLLLLVFLFFAFTDSAFSQLRLTRVAFDGGSSLDVSNYPKVRARLRATLDGQPISLTSQDVHLLFSNQVAPPDVVLDESNGVHIIEWISSQFGGLFTTVLASKQGQTTTLGFSSAVGNSVGGRVIFRDSMSRNVPLFVDFGVVPVGNSDTIKLKVVATEAALENGRERRILLESVAVNNPAFKLIWKGSYGTSEPPLQILSPLQYRVDLVYEPTNNEPAFGTLTATFEGGMRSDVMISANPQTYPRRTILTVVEPNGGESFAPCQEVPISWKGMIGGFRAYVDYSTNNGRTWNFIDSTLDSTLIWEVPTELSDSVRVRVHQKFQSTNSIWLNGEDASATNAAYSSDGQFVAVAYSNRVIREFNVVTQQRTATYSITDGGVGVIVALNYVGASRDIVAAAAGIGPGGMIYHFTSGNTAPDASQQIDADISVRDLGTDPAGNTLYILPQLAARISRFDPRTLAPRQDLILSAPAASSSINANLIGVSMVNGEVATYDATTGAEVLRSQTGLVDARGPITHRVATSLDGRLVAIAGRKLSGTENAPAEQRTFIYDMQTGNVVKILYRESSEAQNLSFSPSNAFLALGFAFNPQFVAYDLVNGVLLPPNGSAAGHRNELTDLAFSPDGSTLVSTSVDSSNNALLRRVSTPESDFSDEVFSIRSVQISITDIVMRPLLIGTVLDTVVTANVCNESDVPAIFTESSLLDGKWLTMLDDLVGDTLGAGECLSIRLRSTPADTGTLSDTIALKFCETEIRIPIHQVVIDRNLSVLIDSEDFGDVCIGSKRAKTLAVLVNNDSVAVTINSVFVEGGLEAQFRVANSTSNFTLEAKNTLEIMVEFQPRTLGFDTSTVIVRYANQNIVARTIEVTGRGSGADIQLSHLALPFIPEIPVRQLVIRNASENPVTIEDGTITTGEPFTLLTTLPVNIPPQDSVVIEVRYEGGVVGPGAELDMTVQPCASATNVRLAAYSGSADVRTVTVEADPRSDTTSIPIIASITESLPYEGVRFFSGKITVHPKLYLAREVTSTIGTGEILSQDIVNGMREIAFRIDGAFRGVGEIGRIIGYAGMAETDSSDLTFIEATSGFGTSVVVTYQSGKLIIVHEDPTRRILETMAPIIQRIAPSPSSEFSHIEIVTPSTNAATIVVVNSSGIEMFREEGIVFSGGSSTISLNVAHYTPGSYRVIVKTPHGVNSAALVVVR